MCETARISEIRKKLKKKLDPARYEHTLGVSFTAAALAMSRNSDGAFLRKAELAGLLHDCAKHFSEEELIERCKKNGVTLTEEERKSPAVIHAKYGRYLAEKKYGISDEDILNAVSYHTTGRAGMSELEKIVFIADYIEPSRNRAQNLKKMRSLAFSDLDRCMYEILASTVTYLRRKKSEIHPDTLTAKAYFAKLMKDR